MKYVVLTAPALLLCSCATVVRGTDDTARFESSPSGADVTVESISADKMGPFDCVTPCELELKRKRTWRVDFALEGYKTASGLLKPVVSGAGVAAGAGNALIGGIIGVGIDAGTGANLDLRPNPMIAELEPVDSPNASRILDAEMINDGEAEVVDAPAETPQAEPSDAADPAPASAPEDEAGEQMEEPAPEIGAESVADKSVGVDSAINSSSDDQPVEGPRIYKPGEPAPDDEVSDDLNRRQLESLN